MHGANPLSSQRNHRSRSRVVVEAFNVVLGSSRRERAIYVVGCPLSDTPSEVEVDVVFHLCTGVYPFESAPHSYGFWLRSARTEYLALDPVGGIPQFIRLTQLFASAIGIVLLIAFAFWSGIVEASVDLPF